MTYHFDSFRTGQNPNETLLTLTNVNSTTFGKPGEYSVGAAVDPQPLYPSQLPIGGAGAHNVRYVATENDTVYALDAGSITGISRQGLSTFAVRR